MDLSLWCYKPELPQLIILREREKMRTDTLLGTTWFLDTGSDGREHDSRLDPNKKHTKLIFIHVPERTKNNQSAIICK